MRSAYRKGASALGWVSVRQVNPKASNAGRISDSSASRRANSERKAPESKQCSAWAMACSRVMMVGLRRDERKRSGTGGRPPRIRRAAPAPGVRSCIAPWRIGSADGRGSPAADAAGRETTAPAPCRGCQGRAPASAPMPAAPACTDGAGRGTVAPWERTPRRGPGTSRRPRRTGSPPPPGRGRRTAWSGPGRAAGPAAGSAPAPAPTRPAPTRVRPPR
ncbi:hypothetical protein G6F59_014375 [Rhizopus arrhizus]|nr:hypothetical protein G6F59_014375 [Rhizopus arrhizus]